MEAQKKYRRTQYFMKGPLQKRYLIHSVLMMTIPTALVALCLYILIFYLVSEQLAVPQTIINTLQPVLIKVNNIVGIGLPIIFAILFGWAVMISHRFAGPMYRLERDLEKIAQGDHSLRIRFRKKDQLDDLAAKLNEVLDKLPQ